MARTRDPSLQDQVLAILNIIQPATVRDVVERLDPPRAFTTVATVLARMMNQGRVNRTSVDGQWQYRIMAGHNRQLGQHIAELLHRAAGDPEPLLQGFIGGVEELDAALLDRLEAMIAERRRNQS